MMIPYAKLNVLIAEDHKFTRYLLREVLYNLGCQRSAIHEVEDGSAGFKIMAEKQVDLVISDWQMQPMDGLEFTRKLRDPECSKNPFVPIILCTAHSDRDLIQLALDAGVTEIMTKPISAKVLESRIREVFERPRPFVQATEYFGPDRRRRNDDVAPPKERRRARRTVIKQVSADKLSQRAQAPNGFVRTDDA